MESETVKTKALEDAFREAIEAYDFDQKEAAGQPEAEKTDGAPA
jgi:hypothetical protein